MTEERKPAGGILRGLVNLVGARGIGIIFTLVQVKISTNYLGPTGYGILSAALVLIGTFEAFTELGIGTIVVRRVAAGADLRRSIGVAQAVSLSLTVVLIVLALVMGWMGYRDSGAFEGVAILSVGLFGTAWAATYNAVAQTQDDFLGVSRADIAGRAVSLAIVLGAVAADAGLTMFFVAQLAAPLLRGIISHWWGRRYGQFRPVWHVGEMKDLMVEALPLTYITVVAGLYFQLDGILVAQLSTVVDVGAYNFAYRIAMNVSVLGMAVTAVLVARFANAAAASEEKYRRTLQLAMTFILALCLPIAALLWPFNANIIRLLGSDDFVAMSGTPLLLLWISTSAAMVGTLVSAALVAGHTQRFLAVLNTCTLLLNLALNLLLIPTWQATGAAAALVVTEVLGMTVALVRLGRRSPGFWPWRDFFVMIGCVLVALGVERIIPDTVFWVVRALLVASAFYLCAFLTQSITPARLRELSGG